MMNSSSSDVKVTAFGSVPYDSNLINGGTNQSLGLEQFLMAALGPRQINICWLIPVTVFYSLVCITGVVGNVAVCLVIVRNKSLHSAMNYYLISLAIADLAIIVLGVPNELSIYWNQYPYPFGEEFCKLRTFVSEIASYASVLTIVAFSLERYLAICRPFYEFPLSDLPRTGCVTALCWTVATAASVPHLISTKLNYLDFPWKSGNLVAESAFCAMLDDNIQPKWYPVHELSFVLFFILPVLVLTFVYISMARVIYTSKDFHQSIQGLKALENRKQIIRMLVSVVVLFFISWAPFHLQRLGYVYFKENAMYRVINEYLFYFSGCLYFLSSTLNPVLYNLMSAKYRTAFQITLCRNSISHESTTIQIGRSDIRISSLHNLPDIRLKRDMSTTQSTLSSIRSSLRSLTWSLELQDFTTAASRRNSQGSNKNNQIRSLARQSRIRSFSLNQESFDAAQSSRHSVQAKNKNIHLNNCRHTSLQAVHTQNKNIDLKNGPCLEEEAFNKLEDQCYERKNGASFDTLVEEKEDLSNS